MTTYPYAVPRIVAPTAAASATLGKGAHTPVDATLAALTMTLPTGASAGSVISLEKVDATANQVAVSGNIRGGHTTLTLSNPHDTVELIADGTGSWWPVSGVPAGATGGGDSNVVTGTQGDPSGASLTATTAGDGSSNAAGLAAIAIGATAQGQGDYSVAIGGGDSTDNPATASGLHSLAAGYAALATQDDTVAIGTYATARMPNDIAIGDSQAGQDEAIDGAHPGANIAIGHIANANGDGGCIAIGTNAGAGMTNATAVGFAAGASSHGVAIGEDANSNQPYGIVIGFNADAFITTDPGGGNEQSGIAIGKNARVTEIDTIAIGDTALADGQSGIAIGTNARSADIDAIAIGDAASAEEYNGSHAVRGIAIGKNARVVDRATIAIGDTASAEGYNGIAIGLNTRAQAGSVAIGTDTTGAGAQALDANEFWLGTETHVYYMPGVLAGQRLNVVPYQAEGYPYNVSWTDSMVACSGTFDVNLPDLAAPLIQGLTVTIKNVSTGTITIKPHSGQTIEGAANKVLSAKWSYVTLRAGSSVETAWYIVG